MEIVSEKIGRIEFRVLGPKMVEKMSVVKVVNPELYDPDGYPIDGGLMDLRMGVIDPGMRCKTCGEKVKECPGHFGYITLARPAIHIKYVPWIYEILRSTCSECSRILIGEEKISKFKEEVKKVQAQLGELKAWSEVKELNKKIKTAKKCPHCGAKQKKIKLDKPYVFYEEKNKLTPVDIRERLERVKDDDLRLLGFDPLAGRPEWMILTLLPVPPVTVRPSITLESGARSEDDITHKLGDIVRANQRLYENLNAGAPEIIIEDLWDLLQYHVTTLFVNNVSQLPPARHRSGRPLKTFAERIKSKEGRFRKNLAGKRVDFSARTVISPEPKIKINEVGIPYEMAVELTVPEKVTSWNIKWLKNLVKNGSENYPGANYFITPEGKRKRITEETKKAILEELTEGCVVERHLINGDTVLFNRQPSLHRQSMMSHSVKVLPNRTFRLNLAVCKPYNADFDGDEMNLHVPQTEEAITEAKVLMDVNKNLITPRYGLPIIGCIKDHLVGAHLLTLKGTKISRDDALRLLSESKKEAVEVKKELTGKELFSKLLPAEFDFECKSKGCRKCADCKKDKCPYDAYVKVSKGKLLTGVVDENSLGAGKGLMLHKYVNDYGPEKASKFLNNATKLFINYLQMQGLTILPSDSDLSEEAKDEINKTLKKARNKINSLIKSFLTGELKPYPRRTLRETLEFKILAVLNKARNMCSRIVEKHTLNTGTTIMAESGGAGKLLNLGMIAACVGQMALRGTRINKGYNKRVLPHFNKDDLSAEPHGFIENGYKKGLNPYEFFLHSIVGRDSLMDTSMRTPKSGYLQRRLINALQDLKVIYDGTVRDSRNVIVQFKYGEDGIDVSKTIKGDVASDKINVEKKKALVAPGEAVGVIAGQSIGEPGTQMIMRTHKFAGVAELGNVTLGLPRIIEIFDARKLPKTPTMTIYLNKDFAESEDKAKEVATKIIEIKVEDVLDKVTIDLINKVTKVYLDRSLLEKFNLTTKEVSEIIKKTFKNSEVSYEGNVVNIKSKEKDIKLLYKYKAKAKEVYIRGVPRIEQVLPVKKSNEWIIKTAGSNLKEVLKIPEVDTSRTTTNDLFEINKVLGIEAARNAIIVEAKHTLQDQGLDVDDRHLMLVADMMTVDGEIKGVNRYGITKGKASVLARASFEVALKHLFDAAVHREVDELNSVVENIMINQPAPIGTGMLRLVVKHAKKD